MPELRRGALLEHDVTMFDGLSPTWRVDEEDGDTAVHVTIGPLEVLITFPSILSERLASGLEDAAEEVRSA